MTTLLYLDLATKTGWAVGDITGRPQFGTQVMPSTGPALGTFGNAFEDWLCSLLGEHKPDHVAFESPFLGGTLNLHTTRKLTGLCFVTEMLCGREGIRVTETHYSAVRMWALGHAKRGKWADKEHKITWKFHMMQAAKARGHDVHDDNQADAVLGWEWTAREMWTEQTTHLKSFREREQMDFGDVR